MTEAKEPETDKSCKNCGKTTCLSWSRGRDDSLPLTGTAGGCWLPQEPKQPGLFKIGDRVRLRPEMKLPVTGLREGEITSIGTGQGGPWYRMGGESSGWHGTQLGHA